MKKKSIPDFLTAEALLKILNKRKGTMTADDLYNELVRQKYIAAGSDIIDVVRPYERRGFVVYSRYTDTVSVV